MYSSAPCEASGCGHFGRTVRHNSGARGKGGGSLPKTHVMKTPTPYLNFPGTCEEAFNFYKRVFGGEFDYIGRFSEMPPDVAVPPDYGDKIMHVSLSVNGTCVLMGSDAPEGFGEPFNAGNNVQLSLDPANEADAKRLYDALRDGGKVTMELAPTFWAKLFAMVKDRYGINWMISYGQPG